MRAYTHQSNCSLTDSRSFCPCCRQPRASDVLSLSWLADLEAFSHKYTDLGLSDDLSQIPLPDLWGIFCFLVQYDRRQGRLSE